MISLRFESNLNKKVRFSLSPGTLILEIASCPLSASGSSAMEARLCINSWKAGAAVPVRQESNCHVAERKQFSLAISTSPKAHVKGARVRFSARIKRRLLSHATNRFYLHAWLSSTRSLRYLHVCLFYNKRTHESFRFSISFSRELPENILGGNEILRNSQNSCAKLWREKLRAFVVCVSVCRGNSRAVSLVQCSSNRISRSHDGKRFLSARVECLKCKLKSSAVDVSRLIIFMPNFLIASAKWIYFPKQSCGADSCSAVSMIFNSNFLKAFADLRVDDTFAYYPALPCFSSAAESTKRFPQELT